MTKKMFFDELRLNLKNFKSSEVDKIIAYYDELIEEKKETGMKEEEAINSCGDIKNIVSGVTADLVMERIENKKSDPSKSFMLILGICFSPILLPIGISFFAVFISLLIALISVILSLFVSSIAVIIGAIGFSIEMYRAGMPVSVIILGVGVALIAGSILFMLSIYAINFSKYLLNLIIKSFSKLIKKKSQGEKSI